MTDEERERIREAARRYVREQAPTPPIALLERIARIVLQDKTLKWRMKIPNHVASKAQSAESSMLRAPGHSSSPSASGATHDPGRVA